MVEKRQIFAAIPKEHFMKVQRHQKSENLKTDYILVNDGYVLVNGGHIPSNGGYMTDHEGYLHRGRCL